MLIKRIMDILFSFVGLIVASPILITFLVLVWLQDFHSPFYIAPRVGRGRKLFKMVKMRSMVLNAERNGVGSTKVDDNRITMVGKVIRKCKLDEFTQLWNVLWGQMSLVGPRPQIERDVELYTEEEERLLTVRPGITDFASIVFADEGDVLSGAANPDLSYQQLIRPWKSRLGIFYIDNQSFLVDIKLILFTITNASSRRSTLSRLSRLLGKLGADDKLQIVSRRCEELLPYPPPGSRVVVESR